MSVEYRILGPLTARRDGHELDLGRPKQRAVLALLLLSANRVVAADRLVDELWADAAPARALASLQTYVSNLRRVLEPDRTPRAEAQRLRTEPPGYVLVVGEGELDAARFESLAAEGRGRLAEGRPAEARRALDTALGLWRGEALADVADEPFARIAVARLTELREAALVDRLEVDLRLGDAAAAVPALEQLVAEQPLRERPRELLAMAYYRTGRQADALATLRELRETLADELGVDPSPAVQRLEQQLLRHDPALDWTAPPHEGRAEPGTDWPGRSSATPFVGRAELLERLRAAVGAARGGGGRVVVLSGEAGIGKSRLAEQTAAAAAEAGMAVAWGRCAEVEGAPAFWPWAQAIRALAEALEPRALAVAAGGDAIPLLGTHQGTGAESERFHLYDRVTRFLTSLSGVVPLAVVLDDLHWADASSLALLRFLAGSARQAALLVLCTAREDEITGPVAECLASLARQQAATRVHLSGWDPAETAEYVRALSGPDVPETAIAAVHERTGGNPFFVHELVRLLETDDRLADPGVSLPEGVLDVVSGRLARLPRESRDLLAVAAVAGREFDIDVLCAAVGRPLEEVLDGLEAAGVARLVVEGAGGRFRFAHALVQETLVAGLPTITRARLHGRVADALAGLPAADPDARLAELAHHYGAAAAVGRAAEAYEAALGAAQRSTERLAFADAVRHLEQGRAVLDRARPGDEEARYSTLLALGVARRRAAEGDTGRAALLEAIAVAEALADPLRMAAAAAELKELDLWIRPRYGTLDSELIAALERTLSLLPPGDSSERARILGVLATERYHGDAEGASAVAAEALAMARRLGDPQALAHALVHRFTSCWTPGGLDEQLELAEQMMALSGAGVPPEMSIVAPLARATARFATADVEGCSADVATAKGAADARRLPVLQLQVGYAEITLSALRGDYALAERLEGELYRLHERINPDSALEQRALQLFQIRFAQGRLAELLDVELPAGSTAAGPWVPAVALSLLDAGRGAEARGLLEAAAPSSTPPSLDYLWLLGACVRAELWARLGERAHAERAYQQLLPFGDRVVAMGTVTSFIGAVSHYLGLLAQSLDDASAAAQHFAAALALHERLGAPVWQARTAAALSELRRTR